MSTSTLGGHVNTIPANNVDGRRRRRLHSDEFKADAVAACMQPGMSMAAVAMSRGVNANLLRRWVRLAEGQPEPRTQERRPAAAAASSAQTPAFMALPLPAPTPSLCDIRIELRRGAMTITVTWPAEAAGECAAWMRELLR